MRLREKKRTEIIQWVNDGIQRGYFPCASIMIGTPQEVLLEYHAGNRSIFPQVQPLDADTLFDLASLTKVLATTLLAMAFVDRGLISLTDRAAEYFPVLADSPGREASLGHLLTHTAGLVPHLPLYRLCKDKRESIDYIAQEGFQSAPGQQVAYSDLGFILMGQILEMAGRDDLASLCQRCLYEPMGMRHTGFCPASDNTASTEKDDESGQWINGSVHDENGRFFQGISGHAGLFSHGRDLAKLAAMLLNDGSCHGRSILSPCAVQAMSRNYTAHLAEDRGLGWSVKAHRIPGEESFASAGGELVPPGSYGHTGFTGTSIWLDRAAGVYMICLTNRVHYGRENTHIIRFRRLFHNLVYSALEA